MSTPSDRPNNPNSQRGSAHSNDDAVQHLPESKPSSEQIPERMALKDSSPLSIMQVMVSQGEWLSVSVEFFKETSVFQLHLGFYDQSSTSSAYIMKWLLFNFKSIKNFETCKEIKINFSSDIDEWVNETLLFAFEVINQTKKKIYWVKRHPLFNEQRSLVEGHCLFLNIGSNESGKGFYHNIQKIAPKAIYLDIPSGFDKNTSTWTQNVIPAPIKEFLHYLLVHQIKSLVTLNIYLFDSYLNVEKVFLDLILEALDIKVVCFDIDPFSSSSQGMAAKRLFSNGNIFRQTHILADSALDQRFGIEQKLQVSLPAASYFEEERVEEKSSAGLVRFTDILAKPKVLVLSNLRLDHLLSILPQVLWLHERIDASKPFQDYQNWYFTMSMILAGSHELDEYGSMFSLSAVTQIAYVYGHLQKLLVVDALAQEFDVAIYGDQSWVEFFPELFQDKYIAGAEKISLIKQKNHINLMFNWSDSWIAGPNVMHNLWNGIPFLNFPPSVILPEYEKMNCFCYTNTQDLKSKLNQAIDFNTPEIQQVLVNYFKVIQAGWQFSADAAARPAREKYQNAFSGVYGAELKRHEEAQRVQCEKFANERTQLIEGSFQLLRPGEQEISLSNLNTGALNHPLIRKLFGLYKDKFLSKDQR